jgi:hypothetical protein
MSDRWVTNYQVRKEHIGALSPSPTEVPWVTPRTVEDFFAYFDARIDLALSMSSKAFSDCVRRIKEGKCGNADNH